jgi:hypothetical protein
LGFVIQALGEQALAAGRSPELYGEAGVLKFPHGMAMHALQWLPLLAWAGWAVGWSMPMRWRMVAAAAGGQAVLTLYSLVQTFEGRGREDLTPLTAGLVMVGLALIGVPFAAVALGGATRAIISSRR